MSKKFESFKENRLTINWKKKIEKIPLPELKLMFSITGKNRKYFAFL